MKGWISGISLLVGLVGLALSYYFYVESKQTREPMVLETRTLEVFASPDGVRPSKFEIVNTATGEVVRDKLFVQEFAFWNKGSLSIRRENVLEPVGLQYSDDVEILEVRITEVTRAQIVQPTVLNRADKHRVDIVFAMLDSSDGMKIQVIYSSKAQRSPRVVGSIESVTSFAGRSELRTDNLVVGIAKALGVALLIVVAIVIFVAVMLIPDLVAESFPGLVARIPLPIRKFAKQLPTIASVLLLLGLVGFGIVSSSIEFAEKEGEASVPSMNVLKTGQ